ncbi:MAG: transporter substrate-binding domain-containing protein [Motiliproteus sp.]
MVVMKQLLSLSYCAVISVLFNLGFTAAAQTELLCQKTPIRVALFNFAPFYSPNEQGQAQGILIDELTQLLDQLGCQRQITFYSAPLMLQKVANGQADLTMVIDHPMLRNTAIYSRNSMLELRLTSYQYQHTASIKRFEQLSQQRVIAIRGYGYGGLFDQLANTEMQVQLHFASNIEEGLELLKNNVGDYLLGYQRPINLILAQRDLPLIHSSRLQSEDVFLVMSSEYRDPELLKRLDQLIQQRK